MMRTQLRIAILGAFVLAAPALRAGTVGVEWTQTNGCGWAHLTNTKPDALSFAGMMAAFGHPTSFAWGDGDFWPDDEIDCSVPGGKACIYGDTVNFYFASTHGGSNSNFYEMATGVNHTIDGLSTCTSDTRNPNNLNQWWDLGKNQTRILNLSTCHGLELTDLAHWDIVADGLHMICAFDGEESDAVMGGNYALYGNLNFPFFGNLFSIKQAWFAARPGGNKAVVMAYGVNQGDALNRRDNEQFSWNMSRLGPRTWRAWAWIQ